MASPVIVPVVPNQWPLWVGAGVAVLGTVGAFGASHPAWALGAALLGGASVALSSRWPWLGGLIVGAGMAITASGPGLAVVLFIAAVFVSAVIGSAGFSPPTLLALAPLLILASLAAALSELSLADAARSLAVIAVVAGAAMAARAHQDRLLELERTCAALEIAESRALLAGDLHDVAGHVLVAILTQIRVSIQASRRHDQAGARRGLERAELAAKGGIQDLRALTTWLAADGPPPRRHSIETLCAELRRVTAYHQDALFETDMQTDIQPGQISAKVATTAVRVVQQCLTNAASHAPGQRTCIHVCMRAGELEIKATNATAPTTDQTSAPDELGLGLGLGLGVMHRRVAAVAGSLTVEQQADRFTLVCTMPWEGAQSWAGAQ
jgi:signal transduction histidine kinase